MGISLEVVPHSVHKLKSKLNVVNWSRSLIKVLHTKYTKYITSRQTTVTRLRSGLEVVATVETTGDH